MSRLEKLFGIFTIQHYPGCMRPAKGEVCTCPWTDKELEEILSNVSSESEREFWETTRDRIQTSRGVTPERTVGEELK